MEGLDWMLLTRACSRLICYTKHFKPASVEWNKHVADLQDEKFSLVGELPPPYSLRSCPSSLYSDAAKEGMIHLLDGSYVQKPDFVFFSDWSRNNAPETLRSYWLSYFNEISGLRVG